MVNKKLIFDFNKIVITNIVILKDLKQINIEICMFSYPYMMKLHYCLHLVNILYTFKVVNTHYNTVPLSKLLFSLGVTPPEDPTIGEVKDNYPVLLDGKLMGYICDVFVNDVANRLRVMKVQNLNKVWVKE